jgi:site-specific DNA recombinase
MTMATSAHTNAAIYCRVSTRQQAEDGSSLDSQEVACRRLAASQGFTVTQVFKEDFPGTELARPMLDQLRGGVKSGTYAAVICYSTDRLSRSPVHLALIAEECQKCEVDLVFVTEPLDSSPEGQLLTFVRGWAAQLEREKIKDRTIRGKAARIASGRLPQGTGRTGTAYGYRYDKGTGRRNVEPSEALVITELFELCATGLSTYKLADRLNQAELPSPLGAKWHPRTVLNILRNPIYMGVTYFNRRQRVHVSGKRRTYVDRPQSEWAIIDGATPPIVDADLFRTVQARLDQPLVRPVPEYTRYLLSGFLRCACRGPACGHELQRNSKYRYYRASTGSHVQIVRAHAMRRASGSAFWSRWRGPKSAMSSKILRRSSPSCKAAKVPPLQSTKRSLERSQPSGHSLARSNALCVCSPSPKPMRRTSSAN